MFTDTSVSLVFQGSPRESKDFGEKNLKDVNGVVVNSPKREWRASIFFK